MRLSSLFFLVSFVSFVLLAGLIYEQITPRRLQFSSFPQEVVLGTETTQKPTGIAIPSQNIWLPLVPSRIQNENWETTNMGVSYWKDGVVPGNNGNAILYGHNWRNLLGNLPNVKPGEEIVIYYSDNTKRNFKVFFTQEVEPNNSSILASTTDSRITLYTCTGFLDTKRFVVVAGLIKPEAQAF